MNSRHVTLARLVISTICVSGILVSAHPFPYRTGAEPVEDGTEENTLNERAILDDLDRLRFLIAQPMVEVERLDDQGKQRNEEFPAMTEDLQSENQSISKSKSKRMEFGFSGLDNIDHILTTLDRNEKSNRLLSHRVPSRPAKFVRDFDRLKMLMRAAG